MPRRDPHLITVKTLLHYTGCQMGSVAMLNKIKRHCRAVERLKKAGYNYDSETGKITRKTPPAS